MDQDRKEKLAEKIKKLKKAISTLKDKKEVDESRIMDRDARINAYYVSSTGDRHKVAENIPYYLLDKLVGLLTKKYAITMKDIEVRPVDKTQYRRTSQPELAEAGFDAAEFNRHMEKLRAREELRKTDPMRALVGDLIDKENEKRTPTKKPEDDSMSINDPRHPSYGALHNPLGDTQLDEFAPEGFDGFEDDNRVPMHFIVEKDRYNRRSKWKKSYKPEGGGIALFTTKQEAIQAAEKFNKLDPNREFAYGGTQMVQADDDLDEGIFGGIGGSAAGPMIAKGGPGYAGLSGAKKLRHDAHVALQMVDSLKHTNHNGYYDEEIKKKLLQAKEYLAKAKELEQGLNEGSEIAHPGQLVQIIQAPKMLDLLPGETFEVRSSNEQGVTLKHGMGTKFDNVIFPHGTYKILDAQGVFEDTQNQDYLDE